jgi:hypothetical protein
VTIQIENENGVWVLRLPVPGGGELIVTVDDCEGVTAAVKAADGSHLTGTCASAQEVREGQLTLSQ